MNKIICRIEALMDLPRYYDSSWGETWANESLDVLLPTTNQEVGRVALFSSVLLRSFPYEEAGVVAKKSKKDPEMFQRMRAYRKSLMIGRDALNLTNQNDLIDNPSTRPIPTFATTLGKVADREGKGKNLRKKALDEAAGARKASLHIDDSFIRLVTPSELRERCEDAVHIDLLNCGEPGLIDEEEYHAARRGMRSVVHLGIVSHIVEPSYEKLKYVQQGIELSRIYGENHDRMVAAAELAALEA